MPYNRLGPACLACTLLGALLGSLLGLLWRDAPRQALAAETTSSTAAARVPAPRASEPEHLERSSAHEEQLRALRDEIARLRSQVERARAQAQDPVDAEPAATLVSAAHAEVPQGTTVLPELLAELERALAEGLIEAVYGAESHGLAAFLVGLYLNAQRPADAWRVAQLLPLDAYTLGSVAASLRTAGMTSDARAAFLQAYRLAPDEWSFLEELRELDPAGALAVLDQHLASLGDLADPSLLQGRLQLLLALGRTQESRALLEELFAQDLEQAPWDVLRQLDPAEAEGRLRALAEAARDPEGSWRSRLAEFLLAEGRREEALVLYEGLAVEFPDDAEALEALAELAPSRALELASQRLRQNPDNAELWQLLARTRLEAGDEAGGIEALARAFELWPGSGEIGEELRRRAPEQYWAIFERGVAQREDDELWGDLGDSYWAAGRAEEACSAWERARQLDPQDGEWLGKLRSVSRNADPLTGEGLSRNLPLLEHP